VHQFDHLLSIMHRLRSECPWDKEQSLETLRGYLLEEAYECVGAMNEAIQNNQSKNPYAHLIEELGDVLLQVIFQAEILSETTGTSVITEILETLAEKLVRRHPHVFTDHKVADAERALEQWDKIKQSEKKLDPAHKLSFDSIAKSLTAIQRADKIGSRSNRLNFDWKESHEVWDQMISEIEELKSAKTAKEKEHELGDVLFSMVQWARHEKIDSEIALSETNERFLRRFRAMLKIKNITEDEFKILSIEDKENLWKLAKLQES
jgi:MazG family protein